MKLKTYLLRAVSWCACLLICAALLTPAALADEEAGRFPGPGECSLTLEFPCRGLPVRLCKVAEVDEAMQYTLSGRFATDDVQRKLDAIRKTSDWEDFALYLRGMAARDPSIPRYSAGTDGRNGTYSVTFQGLDPGLYLVDPQVRYAWEDAVYTTAPYLIRLPEQAEDGWETDRTADFTRKVTWTDTTQTDDSTTDDSQTTSVQVIKLWGAGTGGHPGSIQVELWEDNRLADTVTLSQAGWSYSWTGLDPSHVWSVVEKDSGGYVSSASYQGNAVVITNSLSSSSPDGPNEPDGPDGPNGPDGPEDTEEVDLDDPNVPLGPPPPGDPGDESWDDSWDEEIELDEMDIPRSKLPQTGQLWWPVPLLALGGIGLFLAGWARHRGTQDGE